MPYRDEVVSLCTFFVRRFNVTYSNKPRKITSHHFSLMKLMLWVETRGKVICQVEMTKKTP
jgi:hypothetical protein